MGQVHSKDKVWSKETAHVVETHLGDHFRLRPDDGGPLKLRTGEYLRQGTGTEQRG